ncbi:MAG: trigger factor [Alphaproteobacteria bacterium]|nr:trigger factor [Alphaproteobacteria bacterium]
MQVVETKNEGLSREYTITLLATEIEEKVDTRLEDLRKTANIPGFRPGKVPASLMKQRYGQSVMGEVLEQAVSESSRQAIEDNTLRPAMQPNIEITKFEEGEDLEYKMAIEVLPEIQPMDFSKIEVERLVAKVEDKEIDETVDRLAQQYRQSEPIKRARKSKKGDILVIDFKGMIDGEVFAGGSAEGHNLELGSDQFIPGFEDQLIGSKAGEHVSVPVSFPADYGAESLAGKDAIFEVDVTEIREYVDTVLDDEFAKTLGQESLEELRKSISGRLEQDYAGLSRERLKRDLLDVLEKAHEFEVPPGMVDAEFESIWTQFEETRKQQGAEVEEEDKSDDELKEEYRKISMRRVQLGLLLTEVGNTNNVEVSAEEVNRALMMEAQKYPGQEKEFIELYRNNPEAMATMRAPIFEEKVVDFILELANVKERSVTIEELTKVPDSEDAKKEEKKAAAKKKPAKPRRKKAAPKADKAADKKK